MASPAKEDTLKELLPHDKAAEQAVLGAIIVKNEVLSQIEDILSVSDFFSPAHRHIYEAMLGLEFIEEAIDEITLLSKLKDTNQLDQSGGADYLVQLSQAAPVPENAPYYARIVKDKGQLREVITAAYEIAKTGQEGIADVGTFILEASERFKAIESRRAGATNYAHLKAILLANFERLEVLSATRNPITGVATGFKELDELTRGLQPSDLIILAARPSMGKTAFAMNIAYYAASNGKIPVLIFSLEMPKEHLAMRLLGCEAHISGKKLWGGDLDTEDWEKLTTAISRMMDATLIINDQSAITPNYIRQIARQIEQQYHQIGLIVVDYIQLMQPNKRVNSREQEISEISRNLKAIAKEFKTPVIALSQLNRELEKRPNKRPIMADLRESGALEQDADLIMFIYRDEVYNENSEDQGIAEIIVAKHRNGELGKKRLAFIGQYTKFANLTLQDQI